MSALRRISSNYDETQQPLDFCDKAVLTLQTLGLDEIERDLTTLLERVKKHGDEVPQRQWAMLRPERRAAVVREVRRSTE